MLLTVFHSLARNGPSAALEIDLANCNASNLRPSCGSEDQQLRDPAQLLTNRRLPDQGQLLIGQHPVARRCCLWPLGSDNWIILHESLFHAPGEQVGECAPGATCRDRPALPLDDKQTGG